MVTSFVRPPKLFIILSLVFTSLTLAAQTKGPVTGPAEKDFLPAGPFLFGPDSPRPTYMDAFDSRPVVKSPDGKLGVTVTGPRESYGAWVTIDPSAFPDGPVQVWPIQRSVAVLWGPDSKAFALTDNRYANDSFVLVFGTRFDMGDSDERLGIPIIDLTPIIRKDFEARAQELYAPDAYESDLVYIKALRWVGNNQLLVGLNARTSLLTPPGQNIQDLRVRDWYIGYIVDLPSKKVVHELEQGQLLSQYGIKVAGDADKR